MDLVLKRDRRISLQPEDHIYGKLQVGPDVLETLELPWQYNESGISCVPLGLYQLVRHNSEAHPKTWALVNRELNVIHYPDPAYPNARVTCLIHSANWAFQLQGCIAVGLGRGQLYGHAAILSSRMALERLQADLPWTDEHTLTISESPP